MGTRAKTPTYRVVDSMDSGDENDDLGIRDRYVSQRKKSPDLKKNIVKPESYDGKGPWIDYKSHFDACSQKEKRVVFGRVFERSGLRCAGQRTSGVETRLQGAG